MSGFIKYSHTTDNVQHEFRTMNQPPTQIFTGLHSINSTVRVPQKVTAAQLFTKFLMFYDNWSFIAMFTRTVGPQYKPTVSNSDTRTLLFYSKIHFNTIVPYTCRYPKGSINLRFSDQSFMWNSQNFIPPARIIYSHLTNSQVQNHSRVDLTSKQDHTALDYQL
jgi:hypothetical protein